MGRCVISTFYWPPNIPNSVPTYANFAALPVTGNTPGQLAVTLDTNDLYEWNGTMWILLATPSGAYPAASTDTPNTVALRDGSGNFSAGTITASLTGAASLNVLTSALGNLTDAGTDGITVTGGTGAVVGSVALSQHVADTTHNGYLASTDWNTFNSKQAAGSYITALTGDGTASGPGSATFTLATVNTNTGSFGSSTAIPNFTVNGKGLITAAGTNVVIAPAGTLTGAALASNVLASSLTSLGTLTSLSTSGQITSSVSTGTAPFVISSTTQVSNLNAATAGTATNATNVATIQVSNNASYFPLMVASSTNGNQAADLGTGLTFNPSTNTLTTTTFVGALTGHASLDVATSSLGNLTDAGTDGIVVTGGTGAVVGSVSLAQTKADASHNGYLSSTDWSTFNGKGSGTVTSVTFTGDGTVLSSTPSSAVTTSGTLTASLNTQSANKVLAGPASGSAAAPTFRSLGTTDFPTVPAARYHGISSAIGAGVINWTTKDYDTNNAMSSGTYTVPVAGKYMVSVHAASTATSWAINNAVTLEIDHNGSQVSLDVIRAQGTTTVADMDVRLTDVLQCAVNDTITTSMANTASGTGIVSSNTRNYIAIQWVGN